MFSESQAKSMANLFAKHGEDTHFAAAYCDGVVLYLSVGDQTANEWLQRLGEFHPVSARSDDGMTTAILADFAALSVIEDEVEVTDNRQMDSNTISGFAEFLDCKNGLPGCRRS